MDATPVDLRLTKSVDIARDAVILAVLKYDDAIRFQLGPQEAQQRGLNVSQAVNAYRQALANLS